MPVRNTKRPDTRARRFALNMKTTAEVRKKLEVKADESGRSLTLEVEQQLIKSFEMEERLAVVEDILALQKQKEQRLWPTEEDEVAGEIFALSLEGAQAALGQPWREDEAVIDVACRATGSIMAECSRLKLGIGVARFLRNERLNAAEHDVAASIRKYALRRMPPLQPLDPQDDPSQWSGWVRSTVTLRDKSTGAVVDSITSPSFEMSSKPSNLFGSDLILFTDRYRHRKEELDVEHSIAHVLKDDMAFWDESKGADALSGGATEGD